MMNKKITHLIDCFSDRDFGKKFLENYQLNNEFADLINKILEEKKVVELIEKNKFLFQKYWKSYLLCQDNKSDCLQDIPGYRYFIVFENNFLFCKLKNCFHQQKLSLLNANYLVADFPHNWLTYDLKKEVWFLEDRERNQLMSYFAQFLNWSKTPRVKKSLLLTGNLNTGKTFLTVVFASSFIFKKQKKVAFANAVSLFAQFLNFKKANLMEKDKFSSLYNILQKTDLLVIDDLGSEKQEKFYSFRDDFLLPLLHHRYNWGLLTVLISNFSYTNLKRFYTQSDNKIEATRSQTFFNLIEKNSDLLTLSKIIKKTDKI